MTRPRRVAWVHGSLGFGGSERVLVEQVRALEERGHPVDVWTTTRDRPTDLVDAIRAANRHVEQAGCLPGTTALAWAMLRRRYEAVFTCWSVRAYRAARRVRRVPFGPRPVLIETVHERYGWSLVDEQDRRRDEVDFWIATYDFRDRLREAFDLPEERIAIARPLFPSLLPSDPEAARRGASALRASLRIPAGALVVGYVGRIAGNKGQHLLVPMAARLAAAGLDVHLVIAGRQTPPDPAYRERFDALVRDATGSGAPVHGRLHLLGPVDDAAPVFAASDVVVLLSRLEGFLPLMLIEAMALGVPVVTTDVGGISRSLVDGVHAAVVRKVPDDEEEPTPAVVADFESRLAALLRDPATRARLGAAGARRVRDLVEGNDFRADTLAAFDRAREMGRIRRPRR
jgi:glycosyltransferase involved in cell wall biosynthesis